jgi:drug/metabolite transporter (DMT)-like permease
MRHSSLGIALKTGASLAFSLMYTAIKMAGPVPVGEVIFFRAFFAMVPLFALSALTVGPLAVIRTGRPVFAVVLSAVILHETVGRFRWGAVGVGFAGVLLMIEPHGGILGIFAHSFSKGAAFALGGAFLSAFVVVFIRQMSVTERSETIVFYFMLTCSLAGAVSMIWFHAALTLSLAAWLALAGVLGGIGQICMTFSYRYAEPSLLAPFDYIAMVWAVLLGYFVFGEIPQTLVMAGAGVVIVAGLFIVWREHVRHRNVELAAQAVTPNA